MISIFILCRSFQKFLIRQKSVPMHQPLPTSPPSALWNHHSHRRLFYMLEGAKQKRDFFLLPLGGISEIKQKSENYKAYSIFWAIIITTFIKKFFSRRTGILWQFNFLYKTVIERHHCSKWQLRHFQMFHEHTGSVTKMTRLVKIKWL